MRVTRDAFAHWGRRRSARVGAVLVGFPLVAAAFDACEDVGLLLTLGGHGGGVAPALGTAFAVLKFALITPAQVYVVYGLVARLLNRRSAR